MKEVKHLNIPEGLDRLSTIKGLMKDLEFQVWLRDIPSPGDSPEYRELHEKIQDILRMVTDIRAYLQTEDI